jgi:hypothetical protein
MIGYFRPGISREIGHAVAALYGDGLRGLPSGRDQLRDVRAFELSNQLAVRITQHGDRRRVRFRIAVDEVLAGARQRDIVVGVFWREQRCAPAVHVDSIHMGEVRIAPLLASDRLKQQHAILLVHVDQLGDVSFPGRDLSLQMSGLKVVEIQLPPVVPFGEPDDLTRCRQISPVHAAVPRLEEGRNGLFENVAYVPA